MIITCHLQESQKPTSLCLPSFIESLVEKSEWVGICE